MTILVICIQLFLILEGGEFVTICIYIMIDLLFMQLHVLICQFCVGDLEFATITLHGEVN